MPSSEWSLFAHVSSGNHGGIGSDFSMVGNICLCGYTRDAHAVVRVSSF